MSDRGRLHLRVYVFWGEWQLWPVYAPKADPGALNLGPVVIRWHWDWAA